jgi:6-hydroxytryprostatin B O-methyltransferase
VDLAASARVPEQRLKSMIRMAITNALFREQVNGEYVKHSATSAFLARDSEVYSYATYMCTRSVPMAMHMAAAHAKWGADTTRTSETAYNAAFDTDLPFFDHTAQDKGRMKEFSAYMRHVRSSDGLNLGHLAEGFAWQDIRDGGVVVDVSIAPAPLARRSYLTTNYSRSAGPLAARR